MKNLWTIDQKQTRPLQYGETTRLRYYDETYFEDLNNFKEEPLEQQFLKKGVIMFESNFHK
jgi:hypothetical protein